MHRIWVLVSWGLWSAAGLTAVNAQQYVISTYARGAPAAPTATISMTADASGNVYFADGDGITLIPRRRRQTEVGCADW